MKKIFKSMMLLAAAATAFTACNKEVDIQETAKTGEPIRFYAVVNDAETRATLTTEDEKTFKAAWEVGDPIYISGWHNDGWLASPAEWKGEYFEMPAGEDERDVVANWSYEVGYPNISGNPFGNERVQSGNLYASQYDLMVGVLTAENAHFGVDSEGKPLVFPMERKSSILYFHLTSELDEPLASATLTVPGCDIAASSVRISSDKEDPISPMQDATAYDNITITFAEGTAPSAKDFCLWYNIMPVNATGLTLTVTTTTGKTATLTNTKGKTYAAGKLNKIVKSGLTWEEGEKYYVKVTSDEDLLNGTYLIVYERAGEDETATSGLAFNGGLETLDAVSNTIAVEINGSKILSNETVDAAHFTIVDGVITSVSGFSIGQTSNANGLASSKTTAYPNTISFDESGNAVVTAEITGNDKPTLRFNDASNQNRFRYYKSGQKAIALYLLEGTGTAPKPSAGLSFPESDYEITLGAEFTAPNLTNPYSVSVTYSSSDETVATVGNDGSVEIHSAGKTTITATFDGSDSYKASSASYTLTVLAPPTKVSDVIAGGPGNYTLKGVTVYVASAPNYVIGDETGRMVLYKGSLSLKAGDVINVSGPVVDYNGLREFSGNDVTVESTGETVTVNHGTAAEVSAGTLSVFQDGCHSAVYVSGSGNQSGRNITVGDITLFINPANAATDNSAVIFSGYVAAYSSSHETYTFYQTSLEVDPSVATLDVTPTTLSWDADTFGEDNAKIISVTLNGDASGYTVSYTGSEWSVTDDEEGTITVYPLAANESTEDEKTLEITISHLDDTSLSETVTLSQAVAGGVTYGWIETALADIPNGATVMIVDATSKRAMSNDKGTGSAPTAVSVTITDGEITSEVPDNLKWIISVNSDSYQFGVGSNYLYCTNTNNGVRVGTNANNGFTFVKADANSDEYFLYNTETKRYIGVYNNADWRCYTGVNNNIKDVVTKFYVYKEK